jgi:hypothetical protein
VGRPEFDMRSTNPAHASDSILGVFLVQEFGVAGVAAGTSIALVIAAIYLLASFHRNYLETSVIEMVRDVHLSSDGGRSSGHFCRRALSSRVSESLMCWPM